jgi:hypothetical protein
MLAALPHSGNPITGTTRRFEQVADVLGINTAVARKH